MTDSVRPHRRQPTKLLCPWDSPGKNTGVGCHFPLQCMKVKSESEVAQLCPTLSDPMDCSLPGSSVRGIFQAWVLEWVAISISRHFRKVFHMKRIHIHQRKQKKTSKQTNKKITSIFQGKKRRDRETIKKKTSEKRKISYKLKRLYSHQNFVEGLKNKLKSSRKHNLTYKV